jgi:hypothetical protein
LQALRATGTRALATAAAQPGWKADLGAVRTDWTRDEVAEVFNTPLLDLMFAAASVHRQNHDPRQVRPSLGSSLTFPMPWTAWRSSRHLG